MKAYGGVEVKIHELTSVSLAFSGRTDVKAKAEAYCKKSGETEEKNETTESL
jgi:hypothetical protein